MKRWIGLILLLFSSPVAFSQYYYSSTLPSPSRDLLRSRIVLGSGNERHFSQRMLALGRDFSGIVEDRLTDLFRNPSYFADVDQPMLLGELGRLQATYSYSAFPLRGYLSFPTVDQLLEKSIGLRLGYISRFGLLARGNYLHSSFQDNFFDDVSQYARERKTVSAESGSGRKEWWGDVQAAYGFEMEPHTALGLSYTIGTANLPSDATELFSRTEWSANDTSSSASSRRQEVEQELTTHTVRGGIRWLMERRSFDAVATVEFSTGELKHLQRDIYTSFNSSLSPPSYRSNSREQLYETVSGANVKVTNVQLGLRYAIECDNDSRLVLALEGKYASFSSSDFMDAVQQESTSGLSAYDTTRYSQFSSLFARRLAEGSPDGTGFGINARVGWTSTSESWLVAVASVAEFSRLSYKFTTQPRTFQNLFSRQRTQTPRIDTTDTFSFDTSYTSGSFAHKGRSVRVRVALPFAAEFHPWETVHVRAGWAPQFISDFVDDKGGDNGDIRENARLDLSEVSFGMGVQLFERLQVDLFLPNFGNIFSPSHWNIAAQYNL